MKLKLSPDVLALNPGATATVKTSERKARVPRAGAFERDGLSGLLLRGWSTECNGTGFRLYKFGGVTTGWHDDQSKACAEAKQIEKAQ